VLLLNSCITALCATGAYASVFMLRKTVVAARGGLREPSIVQTPRARLFAGLPNALFGCAYYLALATVVWCCPTPAARWAALAAAIAAGVTSLYLAYTLTFVTRHSCPYCWTAHVVNWLLLASVARLLVP
jgi:uncharacterized membrane protein